MWLRFYLNVMRCLRFTAIKAYCLFRDLQLNFFQTSFTCNCPVKRPPTVRINKYKTQRGASLKTRNSLLHPAKLHKMMQIYVFFGVTAPSVMMRHAHFIGLCLGMFGQFMAELCVVERRQEMTAAPLTFPLSPQESGGSRTAWGLYDCTVNGFL